MRLLQLLSVPGAHDFSLKSFRAGRATALAAAGAGVAEIWAAGEWKSSAFLRYCQADELSVPALLDVVLAGDEDDLDP